MQRCLILFCILISIWSQAQTGWSIYEPSLKSEHYFSTVMIRNVKIGSTFRNAVTLQNSRLSSKIYPNFKTLKPDDIAKFLLQPYGNRLPVERMDSVYVYRAETDLDQIRLLIKKREKDVLISFAFLKKSYLYRSYNEADFFQRLFIAVENKKSGEKTSLWNLLAPDKAWAGFSVDPNSLIDAINKVNVGNININSSSVDNFVFAAEKLGVRAEGVANRFIDTANTQGREIVGSLNNASATFERGVNRITDPKVLFKGAAAVAAGSMFANGVATFVHWTYNGVKAMLYNAFDLYLPGEKEQRLAQADEAWSHYQSVMKQMEVYEREVQNIEIALQMASGQPVERLFDLKDQKFSSAEKGPSQRNLSCSPHETSMDAKHLNELVDLSRYIKDSPDLKAQLCQRLNQVMGLIEGMVRELNVARGGLATYMMAMKNRIMEKRNAILKGPQKLGKDAKECRNLAEDRRRDRMEKFEKAGCKKKPESESAFCQKLNGHIVDDEKEIANCDRRLDETVATFERNYEDLNDDISNFEKNLNAQMQDFLRADCVAANQSESCKNSEGVHEDGIIQKVKASYNDKLKKLRDSQCPTLNADRFIIKKSLLEGRMASQTDTVPMTAATGSDSASAATTDSPSVRSSDPTTRRIASEQKGLWGWVKSLFSKWFK